MSEPANKADAQTQDQATKPDPVIEQMKQLEAQMLGAIQNVKAEFNRKFDSVKTPPAPKPASEPKKALEELIYDDPAAAVDEITNSVTAKVTERFNQGARKQQTAQRLISEFPEIQDESHALTKKADEIYRSLPQDEQDHPMAYKTAVSEAALELGIAPKSKRKPVVEDDDSFVAPRGGSGEPRGKSRRKEGELPEETVEIAALMGVDLSDAKTLERVKKNAKRGYGEYQ